MPNLASFTAWAEKTCINWTARLDGRIFSVSRAPIGSNGLSIDTLSML